MNRVHVTLKIVKQQTSLQTHVNAKIIVLVIHVIVAIASVIVIQVNVVN